ncbi:MAG: SDR family NAD(P)-dependent oxidoreductase [Bryobacteraceae bacterium]
MITLANKVAVVAGASRGCGRGLALALGAAGATVYVTARTSNSAPPPVDGAPGTIEEVAQEILRLGGKAIAVTVDFTSHGEVDLLFERVRSEQQSLDILACAVWGGNERHLLPIWKQQFWLQPVQNWHEFLDAGAKAFWLGAHGASRIMARQPSGGVIAVVSEPILENAFEGQQSSAQETFSHLAHYSINRLVGSFAGEARDAGIAIVGLLPGFMKTERIERHFEVLGPAAREQMRYDLAESPEYAGRALVALASDPNVLAKAGKLLYVADLAKEYGVTDIDGEWKPNFYRASVLSTEQSRLRSRLDWLRLKRRER